MDFNKSIYLDHLEEISILYEQRIVLLKNDQINWLGLKDFEDRTEPHIDALVIGEDSAAVVCIDQTKEGDYGELYGAVRVFCRQNRKDLVGKIFDELDVSDEKRMKAVTDALCYELPESWQDKFLLEMFERGSYFSMIAANIIGYRRLDFAPELYDILLYHEVDKKLLLVVFHALGRIRPGFGVELFINYLHSNDREIVDAAITALIRIGEHQVLNECMAYIGPGDWPKLSLGLYGGRDALSDIFFSVSELNGEGHTIDKDYVLAAGLIGNIDVIPDLMESLSNETIAERAALALTLITGAELYESHFIPEEIDEESLFEDELVKFRKGELYLPGEEPGITITRISRSREDWMLWWNKHKDHFNREIRYRSGKPYSPECLLDNIKSPISPDVVRRLAYDELVVRYGIDIPFETDMFVHQQLSVIDKYMDRLKGNPDGFEDGEWYSNGRLAEQMKTAI